MVGSHRGTDRRSLNSKEAAQVSPSAGLGALKSSSPVEADRALPAPPASSASQQLGLFRASLIDTVSVSLATCWSINGALTAGEQTYGNNLTVERVLSKKGTQSSFWPRKVTWDCPNKTPAAVSVPPETKIPFSSRAGRFQFSVQSSRSCEWCSVGGSSEGLSGHHTAHPPAQDSPKASLTASQAALTPRCSLLSSTAHMLYPRNKVMRDRGTSFQQLYGLTAH